jgi:hypothetical protein
MDDMNAPEHEVAQAARAIIAEHRSENGDAAQSAASRAAIGELVT